MIAFIIKLKISLYTVYSLTIDKKLTSIIISNYELI